MSFRSIQFSTEFPSLDRDIVATFTESLSDDNAVREALSAMVKDQERADQRGYPFFFHDHVLFIPLTSRPRA